MTKKEMFAEISAIANAQGREDIVKFCEHEVELLSRKRTSKSTKPTKRQKENEGVKASVAEVLADATEPMTVTAILAKLEDASLTNQRVSALLRQMPNVSKEVVKGKALFSLA